MRATSLPQQTLPEEEAPGLLQRRAFRMLCYSRFFSRVAQHSVNFALVLLIVDETGQALMSSLLVLALVVPSTAAGVIAGTAADHLPRRLLIVVGDLVRAAVCVLFVRGSGDVTSYYLAAIFISSAGQFASSAEGVLPPLMVERNELARANAIGHAVGGAAQLVGLALLTPLVLRVFDSPEALFSIAAGLFVFAAIQALLIGRVKSARPDEIGGESNGRWWLTGWRAMRSDRAVMHAAIELTLISATMIILGGLIPTYISDVLGLPVDVGAVVLLPAGIGVAVGLRTAGFLAHRVAHAVLSTTGFVAFVVLLIAATFVNEEASFLSGYGVFAWLDEVNIGSFDRGGVLAMMLMFPLGFSYAIVGVAAQTVMNDRVPLHLQGRVGAAQNAMAALASSLPVLVAGLFADLVGVTPVMAVVAAAIGVAALANLRAPRAGTSPGEPVYIGG